MTTTTKGYGSSNTPTCGCGSSHQPHWIFDGYGIPLCKVCPSCEATKRKRYRADIGEHYEADEPIDSD